jgi:hypothetical protein
VSSISHSFHSFRCLDTQTGGDLLTGVSLGTLLLRGKTRRTSLMCCRLSRRRRSRDEHVQTAWPFTCIAKQIKTQKAPNDHKTREIIHVFFTLGITYNLFVHHNFRFFLT